MLVSDVADGCGAEEGAVCAGGAEVTGGVLVGNNVGGCVAEEGAVEGVTTVLVGNAADGCVVVAGKVDVVGTDDGAEFEATA